MIDKQVGSVAAALDGLRDGMTLLVSGFGECGIPATLLRGVLELGVRDLTIVANNAGVGDDGIAALFREARIGRLICSFPRSSGSTWFEHVYAQGKLELEVMPQGTLSERIRCAGAGLGGFLSPVGVDTLIAQGRDIIESGGGRFLLERPLHGDFALLHAYKADRWGNLIYRKSARNFAPVMATAAATTVAEVSDIVPLGGLDPESIVTPGIFVDRTLLVREGL